MMCHVSCTFLWQAGLLIVSLPPSLERSWRFYSWLTLIEEEAIATTTIGAKVRLTWLAYLYHQYVQSGLYVWVAIGYLLHFVNNTYFLISPWLMSTLPTSTPTTWMTATGTLGEPLHRRTYTIISLMQANTPVSRLEVTWHSHGK